MVKLLIRSEDRTAYSSTTSMHYQLPKTIKCKQARLLNCNIIAPFEQINSDQDITIHSGNNTLLWYNGTSASAGLLTVTVSNGTYTGTTLAAAITTAFGGGVMSCAYYPAINKFRFLNTFTGYRINLSSSMGPILGLCPPAANTSGWTPEQLASVASTTAQNVVWGQYESAFSNPRSVEVMIPQLGTDVWTASQNSRGFTFSVPIDSVVDNVDDSNIGLHVINYPQEIEFNQLDVEFYIDGVNVDMTVWGYNIYIDFN